MKTNKVAPFVLSMVMLAALVLSGCASVQAVTRTTVAAPEDVVESFYDWYLGYNGNVIVDGAHRSSEYLSEAFVEKVDELIASFDQGGYDPFLCAQDVPGDLIVDEAMISDQGATVMVHEVWNPGTEHESIHDVVVELELVDGEWKIADIICK